MSLVKKLKNIIRKKVSISYGIELGDDYVRLAGVNVAEGFTPVLLFEQKIGFIPTGLHDINHSASLQKALKYLGTHYGVEEAHIGIPERHFFFRCIRVPVVDVTVTDETIQAVINQYISSELVLSDDDIVCEYEKVAQTDQSLYVAISVVPKKIIRRYLNILNWAHIKPVTIDASLKAMRRACLYDLAEQVSLNVRIEENTAHLSVINKGAIMFDRDFFLPSEHSNYNSYILQEIKRFYADWVRKPYRHQLEREHISKVTLFGGFGEVKELQSVLEKEFRLPVKVASPAKHLEAGYTRVPDIPADQIHRFSTAIGLAIEER